jgi:hypothetical protein
VAEAVSGELQAPKVDDLTWGESNAGQVIVVDNDGEFW